MYAWQSTARVHNSQVGKNLIGVLEQNWELKWKCHPPDFNTFPSLSDAKMKEGIFRGPDISKLFKATEFWKKFKTKCFA